MIFDFYGEISIHPPHAGRDYAGTADCHVIGISIHPPRAGRDFIGFPSYVVLCEFQSTRPVRGGTEKNNFLPMIPTFQSTRPVRGGTFLLVNDSQS